MSPFGAVTWSRRAFWLGSGRKRAESQEARRDRRLAGEGRRGLMAGERAGGGRGPAGQRQRWADAQPEPAKAGWIRQTDGVVTIDDVRALASELPRSYEAIVADRVKFRVGRIVYLAFSRDEKVMGFGFPKEERELLVSSEPDKFKMPSASDMRYQLGARLAERYRPDGNARAGAGRLADGRPQESGGRVLRAITRPGRDER